MFRLSLLIPGSLILAAGLLLTGCSNKPPSGSIAEVGREQLTDLWDMYQAYAKAKGRPPANAKDLKPYAAGAPTGDRVLSDPNFLVRYGTPIGGSTVLAYHMDVPTQGGLVLLSDGSIKSMSAAEFQSAPKAGK
jgi:hypothetical protein